MRINRQKGNGTLAGIVIVVLLLLLGGWYVWRERTAGTTDQDAIENKLPGDESASTTEARLNQQSTSDDINSIDADLKATSI